MCAKVLHLTMSRSQSFLFVSPNIGQCTVFLYHKGMPNVVLLIKSFFLLMWKCIFPIEGKHELTADLQVICSE